MKEFNGEIEYKNRKYKLPFNFNVMEEIQKQFGSIDKWASLSDGQAGEPNAEAVIYGIMCMLNEGIDIENEENGTDIKPFTKKQTGRLITEIGFENAVKTMNDSVIENTKSDEKN